MSISFKLNNIIPHARVTTPSPPQQNPPSLKTRPKLAPIISSPRPPIPNDPALKSTWAHRAWLATGCTTVLATLANSAVASSTGSHAWLEPVLAGYAGYVLSDLGSGVYHWAIDNYGGPRTPFFGSQIEAFQGHHKFPWTITRREFANNLHSLARAVAFAVLPFDLVCGDPTLLSFVGVFSGCVMFSQQFHAWAHMTRSKLPGVVVWLQECGALVARGPHAAHHREPFNNNYCIVSGVWNEFLDGVKFFEALEMVLFFRFGVRPRSWSEPNEDWREEQSDVTTAF